MAKIVNPLYDSSFKYLMEDERSARLLLSALMDTTVESVERKPWKVFIESLTHDVIIVQVRRLKGRMQTRAERMMSLFDSYPNDKDEMFVDYDSDNVKDEEVDVVARRLAFAVAEQQLKLNMEAEDLYAMDVEYAERIREDYEVTKTALEEAKRESEKAKQESEKAKQESEKAKQEVAEKERLLKDKDKVIEGAIKALHVAGKNICEIAGMLGVDKDTIERILS